MEEKDQIGRWRWREVAQDLEFIGPRPQESPDTMSTGSIVDMHLRYQEPEKKSQRKSEPETTAWLPSCVPCEHSGHTRRFAQLLANQFTGASADDARLRIFNRIIVKGTNISGQRTKEGEIRNEKTPKHSSHSVREKTKPNEKTVTIDHVKAVALSRLEYRCYFRKKSLPLNFKEFVKTNQFDHLLRSTLVYFDSFLKLKRLEKEEEERNTENLVTTADEKLAGVYAREDRDKKHKFLGENYSVLVLGWGIPAHHHSASGRWRSSQTRSDRSRYEAVYEFLVLATWLTFKQQHWRDICEELGRAFRSDLFNVQKRLCCTSDTEDRDVLMNLQSTQEKLSAPHNQEGRAQCSLLSMRSPLVTSMLPTTKEAAAWLFSCSKERRKRSRSCPPALISRCEDTPSGSPEMNGIGLIGEPLLYYDKETLSLVDLDDCDTSDYESSSVQLPAVEKS